MNTVRTAVMMRPTWLLFAAALIGIPPTAALAEGSVDTGTAQQLRVDTEIYVDVLDFASEAITWTGDGDLDLYDPLHSLVATLGSGGTYFPAMDGAHTAWVSTQQSDWDITVTGTAAGFGRVYSYAWYFDALYFDETAALDGSFYAIVEGGGVGYDGVVELMPDGFAGYLYVIAANSTGVDGANGRSVYNGAVWLEYPIYLNPPEIASYQTMTPTISGEGLWGGNLGCNIVSPGLIDGVFYFDSNVDGTYHIICDLDGDGVYDRTSDDDMTLIGTASVGYNTVTWDGTDNVGNDVAAGNYACKIYLTVGEFHYVGIDIETSYEGFRLFSVDSNLDRTGLSMFWNDTEVQVAAVSMPNGQQGLITSGPTGIASGTYTNPAVPNINARSWGNFNIQGLSKGNDSYMDTYAWIDLDVSGTLYVEVMDPTQDSDGDLLMDAEELCTYGTDPLNPDTDFDGLDDGSEVLIYATDPLDPDTDNGGVMDGEEVYNDGTDPHYACDDHGSDCDNDGLLAEEEEAHGTDPTDPDSDNDGLLDGTEVHGTNPTDPLDPDSDNDILGDGDEDTNANGAQDPGETDPNDSDSDGGGVTDGIEVLSHGTDPLDPCDDQGGDCDGDGLDNEVEVALGTDPANPDTDGDGVSDGTEVNVGGTDPLDDDTDDDGLLDGTEDANGDGIVDPAETDPSELDSDGDGLQDGTEQGLTSPEGTDTDMGVFIPDGDAGATTTDPLEADTDGGGTADGVEDTDHDGVIDAGECDPNDPTDDGSCLDSDGDGLSDQYELDHGLDPNDDDTDDDGLMDGYEVALGTDPLDADSDGDGIQDGTEVGLSEPQGDDTDTDVFVPDADAGLTTTDPTNSDTDGGGLDDGDEDTDGDGEIDTGETDPNDPSDDFPGDDDDSAGDDDDDDTGDDDTSGGPDDDDTATPMDDDEDMDGRLIAGCKCTSATDAPTSRWTAALLVLGVLLRRRLARR